ncbi:MAG: hypothetical protein ACK4VO_09130 [Pseudobdellovibrio sp.]
MKLKQVYTSIALVFFVVTLVIWKLNDIYKNDKNALRQNAIQAQSIALRSTLASQISQLRNILSGYSLQIEESKINWIQLKPFYVLGVVQEDARNQVVVSKMFTQSGSSAERWNAQYLQQKLNVKSTNQSLTRVQLFVDQANVKQLVLIFFDQDKKTNPSRSGVFVVGDISFLQRFFDLQRTGSTTQTLLTSDNLVAAHSEYEYVASVSKELNSIENKNFVDKQELRGTNLFLVNYANQNSTNMLSMPVPILGIIIGLGFMISGILVYVMRSQVDSENQIFVSKSKDASYKTAAQRSAEMPTPPAVPDMLKSKLTSAADFEKSEIEFKRQLQQMTSTAVASTQNEDHIQTQINVTHFTEQSLPVKSTMIAEERFEVKPIAFIKPIDHQDQTSAVQIQACVQQAIFNVDKKLKKAGVKITKDFQSFDTVIIDYNLFVKIFENIFLNVSIYFSESDVKNLTLKSIDDDLFVRLNIEATTTQNIYLSDDIKNELNKIKCEYEQSFYENRLVLRFQFIKPKQKISALDNSSVQNLQVEPKEITFIEQGLDSGKELHNEVTQSGAGIISELMKMPEDLDIDSILSIDDEKTVVQKQEFVQQDAQDLEKTQTFNLEKEMRTLKVKLDDPKELTVERPDIHVAKVEPVSEKIQIKIRKPTKS